MKYLCDPVFAQRRRALAAALIGVLSVTVSLAQAPTPSAAPIRIAMIEGLSGPIANTGEAVYRNLVWATERVNARGGVKLPGGNRPLLIERFDSKGQTEEALSALRSAVDRDITIVAQGNSSAAASALIDAINKHNEREPARQMLFLNYSAVDPALTNEKCSYWHFRFDAHADMRMTALMSVLREDKQLKNIYLIGQDYSFGQAVLREGRNQLAAQRPDVKIVGEELHPMARVKDFLPYATKIKASGAQAVLTGNWGNDLTLLVKAAREVGFDGSFYTFYGNALGAPAAMGEAGIGKVIAVADWFPNVPTRESEAFYQSFRQRFPNPADDYVHMRMQLMVESLAQAIERAGAAGPVNAATIAAQLEKAEVTLAGQTARMRAADHQFQQPLAVAVMDRQGAPGAKFDVEGSGYGFRVIRNLAPQQAEQPHRCNMIRP
ncbi:branched-chain amino acid ABC transporter substrate-binding protein [Hydrogenophaga sp. PBL-H3]|uniref:branched-chain amino acid ABC transporter substrate-binding protein n=1 Tax=Hydrogenophaga sp. PBL-H3 TaxID=434010 RepID=UPI00132026F2|nr:branched-chain amino acid ABC transporter substrate-binding protein [Hydrogenophaga sp. PBL-H3]QHE76018.1 branched-chain amino acid ABC transporter substrate-binding protein [Hydrogenophaga sp. PBL-H3]QHE80442.1 branched-chain amino acid ABC transporter substrate-binding protein [Hydrogenophaga sp. PBL-H3]